MATIEQEQESRKKLDEVLIQLNLIRPEELVRTDVLGKELSFEAGLPVFQRTLALFRDLSECNLDNMPYETLNQLWNEANQCLTFFNQIRSFSIQQHPQNPAQARDTLITQLRDRWQQYYTILSPHISYAIRRGTDFDALEREARGTLSLQKQLASDFKAEKDKILGEMQGALEKVRQAAAEAGVAQHAIHFRDEAKLHNRQSIYWLVSTIVFGIATIVYALFSLSHQLSDLDPLVQTGKVLQLALPRLVVIFILTFGLVWSARNFSASRHNYVINRHRQNALSSFETFVKGAGDPQTKDAVLLQATQSIFSPQESGFVKSDTVVQPGSQIIEVIRGLSGGKSQ